MSDSNAPTLDSSAWTALQSTLAAARAHMGDLPGDMSQTSPTESVPPWLSPQAASVTSDDEASNRLSTPPLRDRDGASWRILSYCGEDRGDLEPTSPPLIRHDGVIAMNTEGELAWMDMVAYPTPAWARQSPHVVNAHMYGQVRELNDLPVFTRSGALDAARDGQGAKYAMLAFGQEAVAQHLIERLRLGLEYAGHVATRAATQRAAEAVSPHAAVTTRANDSGRRRGR